MKAKPKISVIIPTYNRKEFCVEAIESVLNQTYRDFEVIVVDDGSTDGTAELIRNQYGDKVRYFQKTNGGCASARNFGLRQAAGEYISFLDSDDRYLPEKLEDQSRILDENQDVGFVFSDSYSFDGEKKKLVRAIRPDKNGSITYPLFMLTYLANGSFLVRKKCLDATGYYDERFRLNEDTDFLLRLSVNCRAYYSGNTSFCFRIHPGRKSSDDIRLLTALYESSKNFIEMHPRFKKQHEANVYKRISNIKFNISLQHALRNNIDKALEEIKESNNLYPTFTKKIIERHINVGGHLSRLFLRFLLFRELFSSSLTWRYYLMTGKI